MEDLAAQPAHFLARRKGGLPRRATAIRKRWDDHGRDKIPRYSRRHGHRLAAPFVNKAGGALILPSHLDHDGARRERRHQNRVLLVVTPPAPPFGAGNQTGMAHAVQLCVRVRTSLRAQHHCRSPAIKAAPGGGVR